MNRQIYQEIGVIIAIAIASASLPIGIMGFMAEPIINNYYYENNYYYNDDTNSTEPNYPPETVSFYNLSGTVWGEYVWFHHKIYNLTNNYIINWYINQTQINSMFMMIIQDYVHDLWLENNSYNYNSYGFSNAGIKIKQWEVPFTDTWHVWYGFQYLDHPFNITIRTIISPKL